MVLRENHVTVGGVTLPRRSCAIVSVCLSVILFVCLSVCEHSRTRPNSRCEQRGDLLELIEFWCWSGFRCGSVYDQFFTFLNIRRFAFYAIYCHPPESDSAPALAEFVLSKCSCYYYFVLLAHHRTLADSFCRASTQQCWRATLTQEFCPSINVQFSSVRLSVRPSVCHATVL